MSCSNHIFWFATNGNEGAPPIFLYPGVLAEPGQGQLKGRNRIVELYDSLRPSLFAYLSGIGLSSTEAEDVIQESFLRLVLHLRKGGDQQNLRGWLFRVAHNLSIDVFRSDRKADKADAFADDETLLDQRIDPALNPEEIAIRKEKLQRLGAAMSILTQQQRYTVLLRAEGLRYREIAAVLGISTQRVADLVQRALTRLAGEV